MSLMAGRGRQKPGSLGSEVKGCAAMRPLIRTFQSVELQQQNGLIDFTFFGLTMVNSHYLETELPLGA